MQGGWRAFIMPTGSLINPADARQKVSDSNHLRLNVITWGNHMSDTIGLLETIGGDATLRHASTAHLLNVLEQANASEALTSAAMRGDRSPLFAELGQKQNEPPQAIQSPSHEEHDEESEDDPVPEEL